MNSSSDSFKHLEVAFLSDGFYFAINVIQCLLLLLGTVTYVLLNYVVAKHSPEQLYTYKWYILVNSFFGFIFVVVSTCFRPFALLPYPIVVLHGLADVYVQVVGALVRVVLIKGC